MPANQTMPRKPKITAKQEGGDDGYCYVVRVDGKPYIGSLHRSEVAHYKKQALESWQAQHRQQEQVKVVHSINGVTSNFTTTLAVAMRYVKEFDIANGHAYVEGHADVRTPNAPRWAA